MIVYYCNIIRISYMSCVKLVLVLELNE